MTCDKHAKELECSGCHYEAAWRARGRNFEDLRRSYRGLLFIRDGQAQIIRNQRAENERLHSVAVKAPDGPTRRVMRVHSIATEKEDRNVYIYVQRVLLKRTYKSIAVEFDLSVERIRQICGKVGRLGVVNERIARKCHKAIREAS